MKIFISTSASFYDQVGAYINQLEQLGHEVIPPNGYGVKIDEDDSKRGQSQQQWKEAMLRHDIELVESCDAILVLNFEKSGHKDYVGGSAFLEMFKAFELDKKRYLLNPIPVGSFADELIGMNPVILHGDLQLIPR